MKKLLLGLAIFSSAYAQDLSQVFILKPLIVFGHPKGFEAFKSKKTLTRNDAVDLAQSLNNQLGIFNYSKGVIANDIVLNGLNRDNINILIDGARIYGACPSRMDVPAFHIPLNFIQGVKIVYGPYDVSHQGSMGGLVDVKTIYPKLGVHGDVSFNANSYGFLNPNAEFSFNNGKFYFVGGYSFKTAEPYKDAHGVKITDYIKNEYKSTPTHDFNINSYFAKFGFTPTSDTDIGISYIKQSANNVLYPFLSMDAIYDRSNIVNFHIDKGDISQDIKNLRFRAYYSDVYHLMTNQFRQSSMYMATYARTKAYGSSIASDIFGTTFGIDFYRRDWYAANQTSSMSPYMIPDVFITNIGAYTKRDFYITKSLKLKTGLRIDNTKSSPDNSLIAKDIMGSNYYRQYYGISPSDKADTYLSGYVKLEKDLNQNNTAYVGFGHVVRVPDPEERYIYFVNMGKLWIGNPDLKPAQNNEFDVGLNSNYDKFKFSLDAFYRYITDYITITQFNAKVMNNPYVINEYWNTTAFMNGINIGATYFITNTLSLDSKTSYTRGYQITNTSKHITSPNLPDIPPLREVLSLRYDNHVYFGEVQTILASTQNNVNSDLKEQKVPGYALLNLKTGFNYKRFTFTAGIDNALNQEYYSYNDYYSNPFNQGIKLPEPGRTFYTNITYSF